MRRPSANRTRCRGDGTRCGGDGLDTLVHPRAALAEVGDGWITLRAIAHQPQVSWRGGLTPHPQEVLRRILRATAPTVDVLLGTPGRLGTYVVGMLFLL